MDTAEVRGRQKTRTRRALVQAAADLVRQGRSPTVAEVAEAAEISRATAYRYFPSQEMLLAEVALFAVGGPLAILEASKAAPGDTAEVVARLARQVAEWTFANEQPLRTLLRLSLDPNTGVRRPGHRVRWIADALAPVRGKLDSKSHKRLSAALTLLFGIDPIVVMTDIAGKSREEAIDVLEWAARTLVKGVLADRRSVARLAKNPIVASRSKS
jgi:AcrR family transcriptional regulator